MNIILASTSSYRRQLLERLQIPFTCIPPHTDETALPDEAPEALARRLATEKAEAVAMSGSLVSPDAIVIGSDQVAALGDTQLHKPGTHERAVQQLRSCSGQRVDFFTGVCITRAEPRFHETCVIPTHVQFLDLTDQQIEAYLHKDQPYDCAGSFKVESLGITLFESLSGTDPTALEGLPLIAVSAILGRAGVQIL
ncbi:MAG: nucleoside triphosphate pyrophosphatase [Halioglobus sp.]